MENNNAFFYSVYGTKRFEEYVMSAIFGKLSFKDKIDNETGVKMCAGYSDCKIDKYSTIISDNLLMGCAMQ